MRDGLTHWAAELKDNPSRRMLPDRSVYPLLQKKVLGEKKLQLFECRIDAGFPE